MKYNAKYDRWFTKEGLVYRYNKSRDKLTLCCIRVNNYGYEQFMSKGKLYQVHRAVYETFSGDIPQGYQIDHIDTNKLNNSLDNLRCVTPKENSNNLLTRNHKRRSEFGKKYYEHFGYGFSENKQQYITERNWYIRHNKKFRWEVLHD